MNRVLAVCAVIGLIALAGCGSAAPGSGSVDAASLAPPGALAFATFELAPQGAEKAGFDAAFGKLLGPAPELRLGAAFTKAVRTSEALDYGNDIRPWLGDSVSVVVTRVAPRHADFVLLAASTDDDKAQAAIDKDLAGIHAESRSYRDVDYKILDDGTVNGIVSHFLVAGTESAFRAVVDASQDGKSLTDSEQWRASVGDRGDRKVGLAYVDVKGLLQSLASNLPGTQRLVAPLLLGLADVHPIVATLAAQADQLVVDVSSPGTKPDPRGPGAASTPLIDEMPRESWLALGLPDVGRTLRPVVKALESNPLFAARYSELARRLRERTGLSVENDLLTVGDVGAFARGSAAKLVVESRRATLARLRAFINPATGHRLTVTASVRRPKPLGTTALFKRAAGAIGGRPMAFIDFGRALKVAAASPHHHDDADFRRALPRLRHIAFVAAGARRDGGLDVARAVIGLR